MEPLPTADTVMALDGRTLMALAAIGVGMALVGWVLAMGVLGAVHARRARLALFPERLKVYRLIRSDLVRLGETGRLDPEAEHDFRQAVAEADGLFPRPMANWAEDALELHDLLKRARADARASAETPVGTDDKVKALQRDCRRLAEDAPDLLAKHVRP